MNTLFIVSAVVCCVAAVPTQMHLKPKFRNLFVDPSGTIEPPPRPRIINGHEAKPHSKPYQVFLEMSSSAGSWYCGGVLISETSILTAGHCGDTAIWADITLGAHRVFEAEETQQKTTSDNINVHEGFSYNGLQNDLTLIRLDVPVVLNEYVQPVTLPTRSHANRTYVGKEGVVSGWGLTDGNGKDLSEALNSLEVPVLSNDRCQALFDVIQPSNICTTGVWATGACNMDDGGPLTVYDTLVGIVSFTARFCEDGYPTVHARVTSYLDWIEKNSDVVIQ